MFDFDEKHEIIHTISVKHPGEKPPITVQLTEVQDETGLPIGYHTNVESVICLEQVCKVVAVKLYWNNIGTYQKYELNPGETLEKYEDDFFEAEDYKKLHTILSNTASPYGEVRLDEVLTVIDETVEEVDAVSGATALELDEKDTVPGAALTCFTLWHWAQGDLVSVMKNITAKTINGDHILEFLNLESNTHYLLAIEELQKRKIYSKVYVEAVLNRISNDKTLLRKSLEYIQSAPKDVYLSFAKRLVVNGGEAERIAALKSLQNIGFNVEKSFFDDLSSALKHFNTYQEFSGFLELMQTRNPDSAIITAAVVPMLNEDFLTARRAYYFLLNQNLTAEQKHKVEVFHQKYSGKL
ncbi:hypothetical protein KO493_09870 [Tamlana agarivorans]|uniref:Uncharacterized protein n=1 Tax=Pseudotamlana agarivorans TaxID=481183 RepID=A0ACC5U9P2_9FLAO|nr:hypothetical protein [Tamlana agarivorans]MBU2951005.1 hypothetical protein [Tamlana agarivorans]